MLTTTKTLAALVDDIAAAQESFKTGDVTMVLLEEHGDIVARWLEECRTLLVTDFVRDHLRKTRHLHHDKQSNDSGGSIFAMAYPVSGDNVWKPLGLMNKDDHLFVANVARRDAAAFKLKEELHRLIAKKLGKSKVTQDVFTEEQMESLFGQFDLEEER